MPLVLKCPACERKMQVAVYFQGSTVTCRGCRRELEVPRCRYDPPRADEANAAMDEGEFLVNLQGRAERHYDVRITRNLTRRAATAAVPTLLQRGALLILLVVAALAAMLLIR